MPLTWGLALARGEEAPKKPSPPLVIKWLGSRVLRYAAISRIHSSRTSSHSGTYARGNNRSSETSGCSSGQSYDGIYLQ